MPSPCRFGVSGSNTPRWLSGCATRPGDFPPSRSCIYLASWPWWDRPRFWTCASGACFSRKSLCRTCGRRLAPWAWTGFALQVVTGFLLFSSEATRCYGNHAFEIKMTLILLAGLNMLVFHTTTYKRVAHWDSDPVVATRSEVSLGCSQSCCGSGLWLPDASSPTA